jgi:hypothetical protein
VGHLLEPVRAPAMVALNNRVYVIGGCRDNPWEPLATVQIFNPATGEVQLGPPISWGRCGPAAVVLDGKIHAIGGVYQWDATDLMGSGWDDAHEVFDPATGVWSSRAPLPQVRGGHGAVVLNGKIYVAGGLGDVLQVYDPSTDAWAQYASPWARFTPGVAAVGGKMYVFGGSAYQTTCCGGPLPVATVDRVDPATATWEQVTSMPTARTGLAAAVVGGSVYLIGGSSSGGADGALPVVERFTLR